jgi:glycosyltransferase involved in cell wall biosynthesis
MTSFPQTIVVVNDQAHVSGGAAFVAIAEARELADRGLEVIYFSGVGPVAEELKHPRITVICLEMREILFDPNRLRAMTSGIWNLPAERALSRCLEVQDARTTLVHFHSWMKCLSPAVLGVPRRRGFRSVLTQHDFFAVCPTGGFFDFARKEICFRRPLSRDCICTNCDSRNYAHKLWRVARSTVQAGAVDIEKCIDLLLSVSAFADQILARNQSRARRMVVDNPAPMERRPRQSRLGGGDFLYVGRLSEEKGVRMLKKAITAAEGTLRIVGDGPLRKELEAEWPEATYLGWLSRAEVQDEMRQAQALIFPSLWYETAGLVAIEAAANGLPVIVADSCAATSYVQDGKTGIWFKSGSTAALSAALQKLSEPSEAERLSIAAYQWYWKRPWTISRHVDDLLEAYRTLEAPGDTTPSATR